MFDFAENEVLRAQLHRAHREARILLIHHLRSNWAAATTAAKIISGEQDARWLLEAHRRVSFQELGFISNQEDPVQDLSVGPQRAAYSDILAAEFGQLVNLDFADIWFPATKAVTDFRSANKLLDRLIQLSRAESIALEILMESADRSFVGTLHHANWWTPPIALRLLQSPELDRLASHRSTF